MHCSLGVVDHRSFLNFCRDYHHPVGAQGAPIISPVTVTVRGAVEAPAGRSNAQFASTTLDASTWEGPLSLSGFPHLAMWNLMTLTNNEWVGNSVATAHLMSNNDIPPCDNQSTQPPVRLVIHRSLLAADPPASMASGSGRTLVIRSANGVRLDWQITGTTSFLTVGPVSGIIPTTASGISQLTIPVALSRSRIQAGHPPHVDLTVTGTGAVPASVTVRVSWH